MKPKKDTSLSLEEWLLSTQHRRTEILEYASNNLPADISERHGDIDQAIQAEGDIGSMCADLEMYLSQHTAQELLMIIKEEPDLNAREREIIVKGKVAEIKRLLESLSVIKRKISHRIYVSLNENRSR